MDDLPEGAVTLAATVRDRAGDVSTEATVTFTVDTMPPMPVRRADLETIDNGDETFTVRGSAGSAEPGSTVTVTNRRTGQSVTVTANADGSFSVTITAEDGDELVITVRDRAGNSSEETVLTVGLPPDPAQIAPPVDQTTPTDFAANNEFLYSGPNPVQEGVAPGTIERMRAAVLRGKVLDRDASPLSGVKITIVDHPELGRTFTRRDGMFDMAVNGGGLLTVSYVKDGFLPAQRQIDAPWRDFGLLPDVILVPLDEEVTSVDTSGGGAGMQVARGSAETDADGTRQATLLFPEGTEASIVLPDGTTEPVTSLSVRATEYTVGDGGPMQMPAGLPLTSGYTYAVEFSADEAIAAGASQVRFTKPLPTYVQNFLDFPVGTKVPAGYYDKELGKWVPSADGRVIKILAVVNGLAQVDTDGNGVADDGLGMTDAERERLARLYQSGQSLWRVLISHFTPWDCNWPYGPPSDAVPPGQPPPKADDRDDCQSIAAGSIIECENQTLGQSIPVVGTPFSLNYRSDRVPGRIAANSLHISLSGPAVPASLQRIELQIDLAGRRFIESFAVAPNLSTRFVWDGRDAYGRSLQGAQPATVTIGYVYPAEYQQPADFDRSFARASGARISGNRSRQEITISQEYLASIGAFDARGQGFGGWTLSAHHIYDSASTMLQLGTGEQYSATAFGSTIATEAGRSAACSFSGDGGPATPTPPNMCS